MIFNDLLLIQTYISFFIEIVVPLIYDISSFFWTSRHWRTRLSSSFVLSWSGSFFVRSRSWSISLFYLLLFSIFPLSPFSFPSFKRILALRPLFDQILRMLFIHALEKLLLESFRKRFYMHIITISTPFAAAINVLLALGIEKICNWRKYGANLFAIEKPTIDVFQCILWIFLITIFDIDISHNVVS